MTAEMVEDQTGATRGTSNSNHRGSASDRKARKNYLLETYGSNQHGIKITYASEPTPGLARYLIGQSKIYLPDPGKFVDVWNTQRRIQAVHGYIVQVEEVPTCRCFHCGVLLTFETVTVDRIVPGCKGGTYRRNNIRPACLTHNSSLGAEMANGKKHQAAKQRARRQGLVKIA